MGLYSAKKPYHNLKESIANFYRKRVLFMKQLLQKFSEFEKPYGESSYPEMHLEIPDPDWPTWIKPWIPETWGPSLPDFPFPELPPGPKGPFPEGPPDDPTQHALEGCLLLDLPPEMDVGEKATVTFTGGRIIVDGKTISHESALLWTDGPGSISPDYVHGPYGEATLSVDSGASDGDIINVYALGSLGSECATSTMVSGLECSEDVEIEYTTTTMQAGTSQDLTSSDGKEYWWKIEFAGETIYIKAKGTTIVAPDSNPNCSNQFDVSIQTARDDSEADVCDSITINVSAIRCGDGPRPAFYNCCDSGGEFSRTCFTYYDCYGEQIIGTSDPCCGSAPDDCSSVTGCELGSAICADSDEGSCPGEWNDYRNGAMIAAGCCPDIPS
jgi:hypothetical protein